MILKITKIKHIELDFSSMETSKEESTGGESRQMSSEVGRRPQDEAVLRVLPALGPEAAPDVAGDDADLVLGDLEDVGRQRSPHAVGVLHVRVEGVTVLAGVVDAEGAAGLHVLRVDAADDVAAADHAVGGGEGGLGGSPVAGLEEVGDVVGALIPHGGAP